MCKIFTDFKMDAGSGNFDIVHQLVFFLKRELFIRRREAMRQLFVYVTFLVGFSTVFMSTADAQTVPSDVGPGYFNGHIYPQHFTNAARTTAITRGTAGRTTGPIYGRLGTNNFTITFGNTDSLRHVVGGPKGAYIHQVNNFFGDGADIQSVTGNVIASGTPANTPQSLELMWTLGAGNNLPAGCTATWVFENNLDILDHIMTDDIDAGEEIYIQLFDQFDNVLSVADNVWILHVTNDDNTPADHSPLTVLPTQEIYINGRIDATTVRSVNGEVYAIVMKTNNVRKITVTQRGSVTGGTQNYRILLSKGAPDRGDAPSGYNDASHFSLAPKLRLGTIGGDTEAATQFNATAAGDDVVNPGTTVSGFTAGRTFDDEDGVATITTIANNGRPGQVISNYQTTTTVTNNSGATAYLVAWLDWNGNGIFDTGEAVTATVPDGSTDVTRTFTWNNMTLNGNPGRAGTFLRIRLSSEPITAASVSGYIGGIGEVEDYYIPFAAPISVSITGAVFNDANRNKIINTGEQFSSMPVPMYVYLINIGGIVVDSVQVAANGSYTLYATPNQNYSIELSTQKYALGTNIGTTPINNTPPAGWVTTGENSNNSNIGTGDFSPDGVITNLTVFTTPLTNRNFGITCASAGLNSGIELCASETSFIPLFELLNGGDPGGTFTQLTGSGIILNPAADTIRLTPASTNSSFQYSIPATAMCAASSSIITISLIPAVATTHYITICEGDSVCLSDPQIGARLIYTGQKACYRTSGTYTDTLVGALANGCDSIVTLHLTVIPKPNAGSDGSLTICNNSTSAISLASIITGEDAGGTWTRLTGTGGTFNAAAGTFTPAIGATGSTFRYIVTASSSCGTDTSIATITINLCAVEISGSVFNDLNGNTLIDGSETGTSAGTDLYVYLVDSLGIVKDSSKVLANGSYVLNADPNKNYTIELSTAQYPVGHNSNTTPISNTLPAGWVRTGENGNNNTGSGDGNPDGVLSVQVGTSNTNNQNFGIRRVFTISGHVYNDPDAGNITNSAVPFSLPPEGLVAVLIDAGTDTIVRTASVNYTSGLFTFSNILPGDYYVMVITPNEALFTGYPAPHPILETGWTRTGESILPGGVPDALTNGRTETFSVVNSNVAGILFGIQERPVADNKMNHLLDNRSLVPVALSVDTGSDFTQGGSAILSGSDFSGGTITNYTINVLPKYGTLYLGGTPVTTLSQVATLTPGQFATLSYQPGASAMTQEQDIFTYYVTDNANTKSNNATYVIPFPLLDSDGDGIPDRDDLDDDNDGITDIDECPLNNLGNLVTAYQNGEFIFIRPSMFGYDANNPQHRTGLNISADVSTYFGYPSNSGAIIVTISNANTHPTANEFYVNDSTGPSQWRITGTVGTYATLEHGQQYFSYDTRTITLLNATPAVFPMAIGQVNPLEVNWTADNDGYNYWQKNDNPRTYPEPSLGLLAIALPTPEPKYFQFASTANNRDEWATYFVLLLPECDHDMDGIPDRLDLDSDNDGCPDAVEGSGAFGYNDMEDAGGTVWVGTGSAAGSQNLCRDGSCVDANGIPIVAGPAGQGVGTSQNAAVLDPECLLTITGAVFDDGNGNTIIEAGETLDSLPVLMYVYLVNSSGIVVDSAHVQPNGSYVLNANPNQNYTLELSVVQYPIGTNTATTPIDHTPPAGWVNTGENGNNNTGPGDGNPDGVLAVSVGTTSVTNQNFGIEQRPETNPVTYILTNPDGENTEVCLDGFTAPLMNGSDPEDGVYSGSTGTNNQPQGVIITSLPAHGQLFYYGLGVPIVVKESDVADSTVFLYPDLFCLVFSTCGDTSITFRYAYIDAAGVADSTPADYTVKWTNSYTITGNVFHDGNGNTIIDTGETFSVLPVALYVYLVDMNGIVRDSAHVQPNGSYMLNASISQNYTLELSAVRYPVGTDISITPINNTPPAGWVNTGENGNNNTGSGDGSPDGVLAVELTCSSLSNKNFGIQQPPVADSKTYHVSPSAFSSTPPPGYPDISTPAAKYFTIVTDNSMLAGYTHNGSLTGNDEEDCQASESCNTGSTFVLDSLYPATKLFYDFGGEIGPRQLTVGDTIKNYDPSKLVIYALEGSGIDTPIGFTYSIVDNAGFASPAASYTILTESALPVELLYFTATNTDCKALLNWATASELNNDYFDVERSTDAKIWKTIARINGNGTTSARNEYDYEDEQLPAGIVYYRLKQVDFDGAAEYHRTISIDGRLCNNYQVKVYPNPVSNLLTIEIQGDVSDNGDRRIILSDITGRDVLMLNRFENVLKVDVSHLPAGTYFVRMLSGKEAADTYQIIITR